MISKKDLDSAELETVRTSRSPTTVMTAQRRGANQRRSDGICQRIGLIRHSYASWRNSPSSFSREALYPESLYVNATQISNKWDCRKSIAQSERRDICGAVAVRSGQWMVGGFHGMLLLSAKHSRSLVCWEDTIWKAVRNALQRTSNIVWSNGRISLYFCEGHIAIK